MLLFYDAKRTASKSMFLSIYRFNLQQTMSKFALNFQAMLYAVVFFIFLLLLLCFCSFVQFRCSVCDFYGYVEGRKLKKSSTKTKFKAENSTTWQALLINLLLCAKFCPQCVWLLVAFSSLQSVFIELVSWIEFNRADAVFASHTHRANPTISFYPSIRCILAKYTNEMVLSNDRPLELCCLNSVLLIVCISVRFFSCWPQKLTAKCLFIFGLNSIENFVHKQSVFKVLKDNNFSRWHINVIFARKFEIFGWIIFA